MLNLGAMERVFDAIIVGLGPAGAAAAVEMARSGAKVLALNGARGRDKPCGGCLSARGLEAMAWLEPPVWMSAHPVRRLWIGYPGRPGSALSLAKLREPTCWSAAAWTAGWPGRTARAGAQVLKRQGSESVSREQGLWRVEGAGGPWRAKWLLAAGGAGGLTARRLGLGGGASGVSAALVQETASCPPGCARFCPKARFPGAGRGGRRLWLGLWPRQGAQFGHRRALAPGAKGGRASLRRRFRSLCPPPGAKPRRHAKGGGHPLSTPASVEVGRGPGGGPGRRRRAWPTRCSARASPKR